MKKLLFSVALIAASFTTVAQVGVGTVSPKATLDIQGSAATATVVDGLIIPRLTANQLALKTGYGAEQNGALVYITEPPIDGAGNTVDENGQTILLTGEFINVVKKGLHSYRYDTENNKGSWSNLEGFYLDLESGRDAAFTTPGGRTGLVFNAQKLANYSRFNMINWYDEVEENRSFSLGYSSELGNSPTTLVFRNSHGVLVGNNRDLVHPSAKLEVRSTTQGFLPPVMTDAQIAAIESPAEGLMVYCTTCPTKGIHVFDGSTFKQIVDGSDAVPGSSLIAAAKYPAQGQLTVEDFTDNNINNTIVANLLAYEATIARRPNVMFSELQTIVDDINELIEANDTNDSTAADAIIAPTGDIYHDRNIGATARATSLDQTSAIGNMYQWGRKDIFTSAFDHTDANNIQVGPVTSVDEANGNFAGKFITSESTDYITGGSFETRWNIGTDENPIKNTTNDPCISGFRVPSRLEITGLSNLLDTPADGLALMGLSNNGFRSRNEGRLVLLNDRGYIWYSAPQGLLITLSPANAVRLSSIQSSRATVVRCIRE